MNWLKTFVPIALAATLGGVNLAGQSDAVVTQVAAAKAAGGQLWPSLVNRLCSSAQQPPSTQPQAPQPTSWTPPAKSEWYREPEKVFDNMYIFPIKDTSKEHGIVGVEVAAWAVKGSNGIVLLDSGFDYAVKESIDNGLRKFGLDPSQIKYLLVTHGHGDHFGGTKYLQELYNPQVFMGPGDWELVAKGGYVGIGQPQPKRDKVATDGQKFTVGDTTVTAYLTPGHTPGTLSFLIPVTIKGTPHVAAFWGGTAMGRGSPAADLQTFSASAQRFADIAAKAGADIMLSNHDWAGEFSTKLAMMKANPNGPNPFVVGVDVVRRYTQVLDHCAQASLAAQKQ